MAKAYRPVDRDQVFLLPPAMNDWLSEDHLVWFVIAAVERLDTAAFHSQARLGGVGRRGYDPDMLLSLFVYAMAHGERSSRRIERLCQTDVAFRIICAGDAPDHTVLARFRKEHQPALEGLLTQVLVLCAELGMLRLGVVAFDGTKVAANAAKGATYTEAHVRRLAEEFVTSVADTDADEDVLFGEESRGDEVPDAVRNRTDRKARIQQALEEIERRRTAHQAGTQRQRETAEAYDRARVEGHARPGRPPKGADPVVVARTRWERERARAQERYDEWVRRAEQARREGRKLGGPPRVPPDEHGWVRRARVAYDAALAAAASAGAASELPEGPEKANLTDPDSRLMKTQDGWVQGYNCQTAVSEDGFIITARATQDANDVHQFVPTMNAVCEAAERLAGHTGRDDLDVGTLVGDAGYDSADNLDVEGPDRLIADGARRDVTKRAAEDPASCDPPVDATAREKMTHRLRTEEGHALYKRRAPIVEGANAWLKDRRGLRRFSRRGLQAVQSELAFASAVTNLVKLTTQGVTAVQLRTG